MHHFSAQNELQENVLMLPRLFDETMQMIFASYEFFDMHESLEEELPLYLQTIFSNEMSRITLRLTSIMTWLMARKAVLAERLSEDEADEHFRLMHAEYCLTRRDDLAFLFPDYMNHLLDGSYELYERVCRLTVCEQMPLLPLRFA